MENCNFDDCEEVRLFVVLIISNSPFFRTDFAAHVFDNKLFVFGGEELSDRGSPQTCEYFDGDSWYSLCMLPPDVRPLAAMVWKNVQHPENIPELYGVIPEEDDIKTSPSIEVQGA